MPRNWKTIVLLLAGIGIAASMLLAIFSGEPEPSYQGRTLSGWLLGPSTPMVEAEALAHMGTNALPYLVNWACDPPPRWRKSLADLCLKHPNIVPKSITDRVAKRVFLHNATRDAFSLLHTNAYPALPQLSLRVANQKDAAGASGAYRSIIAILGGSFRAASLSARAYSQTSKAALEQALQHPDPIVQQAATNAHRFGQQHNWP